MSYCFYCSRDVDSLNNNGECFDCVGTYEVMQDCDVCGKTKYENIINETSNELEEFVNLPDEGLSLCKECYSK